MELQRLKHLAGLTETVTKAKFKLKGNLQAVLDQLDKITENCSDDDLLELWQAGYLPTGVKDYLMTLHTVFRKHYSDAPKHAKPE